jgi:Bacterial protein of unknown function (DUF899)
MSAFARDDGTVYHTYSTYPPGLDSLWGMYQWLDRAPRGRNEPTASGGVATTSKDKQYRDNAISKARFESSRGDASDIDGQVRQGEGSGADESISLARPI